MTDSVQVFDPLFRVLDTNGDPVSGAKIYFDDAGTTDDKTTYSDSALTTPLSNPIVCDSSGAPTSDGNARVNVYVDTSAYKCTITDADDVELYQVDNQKGALDTSSFGTGSGTYSRPVLSKAADYTIVSGDAGKIIQANPTGATFTLTLPSAVTVGDGFTIAARHDGTANEVRWATVSSQTIDIPGVAAASGYALRSVGHFVELTSDGANWAITTETLPLGEQSPITIADLLTAPPTSPTAGAMYIIEGTPTGDWASFSEHDIVQADGQGGWHAFTPPTDSGWEAYVQDGNVKYRFEASAWVLLDDKPASASALGRFVAEHTETQNTAATAGTTSQWNARKLNNEVENGITGVSLSSNQVTLPTGKYLIHAWQNFNSSETSATRFQSTTDSDKVIEGGNAVMTNSNAVAGTLPLFGYIEVTAASEVFELQYYVSTAGIGNPRNISSRDEVYANLTILDLASLQGPTGSQGTQGDVGPGYQATSTTSLAIGTGSKAFTTQSGLAYTAGGRVKAASDADTNNYMVGNVASYSSTTLTVTVDKVGGSGTLADWNINVAGEDGETGSTGSNGQVLVDYTMDSASQADSDPGAGTIRANNATPASVTAFYINDADRLGDDQSTAIDGFDASTSSGKKATMYVEDLTTGSRWTYGLTAVSDSTGYWQLDVSHEAGTDAFASNNWAITIIPRGDAGSGDVTGVGSSVDDEIALFDGTGGKTIKRATQTGVLLGTSGVISAATLGGGLELSSGTLRKYETFAIAASDETTVLTTGTGKAQFRMPYALTATAVIASLTTPQTSGNIFTVDINEAGTTILSTKLTIDNGEDSSETAVTAAVISDSALAADAEMTVDIDQVGDGTATGLKVYIIGYRP